MKIEQSINNFLNRMPYIKKIIKRVYQFVMYIFSPKIKCEGRIEKITPNDEYEYFFGYYDKSPWNADERYMVCLRAKCTWEDVSPKEPAEIVLIDTQNNNSIKIIGKTSTWNVQQGCMLQWLGPKYDKEIIYNDYINNKYCSVILNVENMESRIIDFPIYSVSSDGSFALSLDYSRLYNLRPGYGYYNVEEKTKNIGLPDATCIWKINLKTGKIMDLLKYTDFANFKPRKEMKAKNSIHKVNHIMISPSGKRFMVLYRWFNGQRKYSRLITCDIDGKNMYLLSDDDMVSHCCWKNGNEILAFENKNKFGTGYFLMKDKTQEFKQCWKNITNDGHPSYSPNGKYVVTDSYPSRSRIQTIKVMANEDNYEEIAKVFSPFKYDNDTRCDLHPRWDRKNKRICFDSVFEGKRGLYIVDFYSPEFRHVTLSNIKSKSVKKDMVSCIIPTYKRSDTLCRAIDSILAQTYKNIEVLVVDDNIPGSEYSLEVENKLKKYNDIKNLRLIKQEEHKNGAVARNVGVREAKGEYVAFLDDDDEWLPNKIEKQLTEMRKNGSDIVSCYYSFFKDNKKIRDCYKYTADNIQFKILERAVSVYTSNVLIKKDIIYKFNGFDEDLLRHQDLQFLVDATNNGKFSVVGEYLTKIHIDSDINKPNVDKLIEHKKKFFLSVEEIIKKYSKSEQRRIKNAHNYEIAFSALKNKRITIVIKYVLKSGIDFLSIHDLYERMKNR